MDLTDLILVIVVIILAVSLVNTLNDNKDSQNLEWEIPVGDVTTYSLIYRGGGDITQGGCKDSDFVFRINMPETEETDALRIYSPDEGVAAAFAGQSLSGYQLDKENAFLCVKSVLVETLGMDRILQQLRVYKK